MFNFVYEFLANLGYTHPIHPTEVHMPIGLAVGAFLFSWIALFLRRPNLARTARHCIILAFIWVFPTILFGIMDWQHYYAGAMLFPVKMKLIFGPIFLILLAAAVILGHGKGAESKTVAVVYGLCFITVVILGFFGGQMVYGVKSPRASEEFKAGAKIFASNCSACHPHGGNTLKPNLPLIRAPQLADLKTFSDFIRNPRMPDGSAGIMPAFAPTKISGQQERELYDYIVNVLARPARK